MRRTYLRSFVEWSRRNGLFFALILLGIFFSFASPDFLTRSNLTVVLLQVSVVGLVAFPAAMLVLAGYVDLAVGSIAVLAAIVFGELVQVLGMPVFPAVLLALGVGLVWELLSGYLIAYLNFSPIVVTLGGLAGGRLERPYNRCTRGQSLSAISMISRL